MSVAKINLLVRCQIVENKRMFGNNKALKCIWLSLVHQLFFFSNPHSQPQTLTLNLNRNNNLSQHIRYLSEQPVILRLGNAWPGISLILCMGRVSAQCPCAEGVKSAFCKAEILLDSRSNPIKFVIFRIHSYPSPVQRLPQPHVYASSMWIMSSFVIDWQQSRISRTPYPPIGGPRCHRGPKFSPVTT